MNDMAIHRMVMAPILVVAALKYCISSIILPSEAGYCKHIGPYRIAKRVLWNERFVA